MPQSSSRAELGSSWELVRQTLRRDLPPQTFELWLEPLRAEAVRDGELVVSAPRASLAWVERRYGQRLAVVARELIAGVERLGFVERGTGAVGEVETPGPHASLAVDPGHTFERFVIGPGNRLGHAAALAVAELPGEAYNPLFLHGPPGLGKTHLLGAVVNYLQGQRADLTVHYTTAERFTSEFVTALRLAGPERFKERYRNVDALLIDDVQVIEGKPRTEEEFVHTFNALHAAGKQIVLSSDRPPQALSQLAERLRDRFDWGLTVELEQPDVRTRLALLWRLVSDLPLDVSEPSALAAIARGVPTNVRRLEGAMTRVAALGSLLSEPLTNSLAERALNAGGMAPAATAAKPTIEAVQDAVALAYGLTREELLSPSRVPRIAQARQAAMFLCRELVAASLPRIAAAFKRDHTTVLHALRAVERRLEPGSETQIAIHRARTDLGVELPAAPRSTVRDGRTDLSPQDAGRTTAGNPPVPQQ